MSTALAIASVTQVLKDLLNNGLIDHDVTGAISGNVTVTALPPDRIDTTPANQQSQLNLFMYQVTPNQGWYNVSLPSRDGRGERISNPPLALDLHYLLTAYGANELHAEILLGYGMQLLHETPVLARDAIRRALAPPMTFPGGGLPAELRSLSTSELAEQVEQVKITPESLNTEEISKLWTAFQAKYRPTAAYQATVVLIESRKSTKSALPVRARKVYVSSFRQPVIEKIMSQVKSGDPIVEDQPILAGYNLVIAGRQLLGNEVRINVGGIEVMPGPEDISEKQIIFSLPANLHAGVQAVQVIHQKLIGSPPTLHRGVESNVAAFILRPRIEGVNATSVQNLGNNLHSADVQLTVKPAVGETQRVILLLNEFKPAPLSPPETTPPLSYSFVAPPMALSSPPGPTENLTIPITGVKTGTYLARIQVDGAESSLGTDLAGRYNSPQLSIP
jgi:hypothetical protein